MIADDSSKRASDLAFEAHFGVIYAWSLAVWEGWAPPKLLQLLIESAKQRLSRAKSIWNVVYGPAAALVAIAGWIGWSVISTSHLLTDSGASVDLMPILLSLWRGL